MSICDIRIISAAWHVPCVNDTWLHRYTTTVDRNFTRGEVKFIIGTLLNSADTGTGTISDEENKAWVNL